MLGGPSLILSSSSWYFQIGLDYNVIWCDLLVFLMLLLVLLLQDILLSVFVLGLVMLIFFHVDVGVEVNVGNEKINVLAVIVLLLLLLQNSW